MKHLLTVTLFLGLVWGQALHFKNNSNETIEIKTGEKLQINDNKYTLLKTDYSKQYVLVNKHNSQIQDTLAFNSVVSFRYYEKSLKPFTSSVIKGAKYGVFAGAVIGLPDAINYGFHWVVLGSFIYGSLGAIGGAVYSVLIPIESDKLILGDKEWQIVEWNASGSNKRE